jgi:ADP-ribosyl-[dinitrogen reductase] hydrolase
MLCLLNSLYENKGFNHMDQIEKYEKWRMKGYMSVNGNCFDVGRATDRAINDYIVDKRNGNCEPKYYGHVHKLMSGNGSIMRLAPVPIFWFSNEDLCRKYSRLSSKVTHGSELCLDSAELMGILLYRIFNGNTKEDLFINLPTFSSSLVNSIANKTYLNKAECDIETSGFVIHTLEAALWAFMTTEDYKSGLYLLARLGKDVDTVLCVYGQIAGAYYGYNGIPENLVSQLQNLGFLSTTIINFISFVHKRDSM